MKIWIFWAVGILLLWAIATAVAARFFQRQILLHPTVLPPDHRFVFDAPFDELWFIPNSATKINALLFKTNKKDVRGIILYFHGNKDDLRRWAKFQIDFTTRGYDFLAIDYPGFGKSTGPQTEANFYASATCAHHWAMTKYDENKIILFGRSLGTGIAVELATKTNCRKLILETPYADVRSVEKSAFPIFGMPDSLPFEFNNASKIRSIKCPILIVHGTEDRIVPLQNALLLRPLLKPVSDEFLIIEKGAHADLQKFPEYQNALDRWLLDHY